MAWALQFDGTNDRTGAITRGVNNTHSVSVTCIFDANPSTLPSSFPAVIGQSASLGSSFENGNFSLGASSSNTLRLLVTGSAGRVIIDGTPIVVGVAVKLECVFTDYNGNCSVEFLVDDISQGTGVIGTFNKSDLTFGNKGLSSDNLFYGKVLTATIDDIAFYDAAVSSHAAGTPILTDTIGGNNATGVNMPTDGSAWVDLGGGGVTVTATLGAIAYTSQNAVISLAGAIDVSATLGTISYSSNSSVISLTGSVDVSATLGLIDYASQGTTVSLSGIVDVTPMLGSINYSSKNTTVSVTGDVDIAVTLGAINYTSNNSVISLTSEVIINSTLGAIDYTSQSATVTLAGLIDVNTTLGAIVYNSYNVSVSIGEGQLIGNVTSSFKSDIYSPGFKPNTITVNFK